MANLALGKLPLEKEIWGSPEKATDNEVYDFTGTSNFAFAKFPALFTLDLDSTQKIHTIRFFLYDGQGGDEPNLLNPNSPNAKNARKLYEKREYRYELYAGNNLENLIKYYDTTNFRGANGWQIFHFNPVLEVRYVRLLCKHNSFNDEFHITELEIFDTEINALPYNEVRRIGIREYIKGPYIFNADENTARDTSLYVSSVIDDNLKRYDFEKLNDSFNEKVKELSLLKKQVEEDIAKANKLLAKLNLSKKSLNFLDEANRNDEEAKKWFWSIVTLSILLLVTIILLFYNSQDQFYTLSKKINASFTYKESNFGLAEKALIFEFLRILFFKALLLSFITYLITFCVKNYKSLKHNYVINNHKGLAIISAINLQETLVNDSNSKDQILIQATNAIFSHTDTGYNNDVKDSSSSNIINNITDKVPKP